MTQGLGDLDELYKEVLLDHYRNPRNTDLLDDPESEVDAVNPFCGDEIHMQLGMVEDKLSAISVTGQGCSISQASASMMSAAVKGKTIEEARDISRVFKAMMSIHEESIGGESPDSQTGAQAPDLDLGDLEALRGVVKFPVRIKCATLSWNTLIQGIDSIDST